MIDASIIRHKLRSLLAQFLRHHHLQHHVIFLGSTQCCPAYQTLSDQLFGSNFRVGYVLLQVSKADKISAIGSFLFGYDSGIIGSVISDSYDEFHTYFKNPDPSITGAVVSVFAGGAFCR